MEITNDTLNETQEILTQIQVETIQGANNLTVFKLAEKAKDIIAKLGIY